MITRYIMYIETSDDKDYQVTCYQDYGYKKVPVSYHFGDSLNLLINLTELNIRDRERTRKNDL